MSMLRQPLKATLALITISCLTACVPHLNQQQCASMDWYQVGYTDGTAGKYQRDLTQSIADCAKFKLTVDTTRYSKGWNAGVRKFCQPNTAMQLGVNGQTYNNICPPDLSAAFKNAWRRGLRRYCVPETGYNLGRSGAKLPSFCAPNQAVPFRNAYTQGRRVYTTIKNIDVSMSSLDDKKRNLSHRIWDNERQINRLNEQLNNGAINANERRRINNQIRNLNDTTMQLRDQISDLQSQKTQLKQQELDIQSH